MLRADALKLDFSPKEKNGHTYQGVGMPNDLVKNFLHEELGKAVGAPIVAANSFFRLSKAGEETPHWIHIDNGEARWAAVYYLTPSHPIGDGTKFWRSIELGSDYAPESINQHVADYLNSVANDHSKFEGDDFVQGRFNRLISYPTRRFHSRFPKTSSGLTNEDGRLIWCCFYNLA